MGQQITGKNDLKTWCEQNGRMEMLSEWDSDKNIGLSPDSVSRGTAKIVWWKCLKCGFEWQASVLNRSHGSGCPSCGVKKRCNSTTQNKLSKKGSLSDKYPEIAAEWNYEKNGDLKPDAVLFGSRQKVWWKCSCGNEWESSINDRTSGNKKESGCPTCSLTKGIQKRIASKIKNQGSLLDSFPEIAAEWSYERNGNLKPSDVTFSAGKKVWWLCSKGHEWQVSVASRTSKGTGCPICSNHKLLSGYNDLKTMNPEIAAEWNYEKNGDLKPENIITGSSKKVWWKCKKGHEWCTTVNSRISNDTGCPVCSYGGTSKPEQAIAYYLEQVCYVEQRIKINNKEVDVYLPQYNVAIEYDGIYYHKNKGDQDYRKSLEVARANVILYRIIESDKNKISANNFYYVEDQMRDNYEWALRSLFVRLSEDTGDKEFERIDVNVRRDSIPIRERYDLYQKEHSLATLFPDVSSEWNYEKNGQLTPDIFSPGTRERVWWKCSKGHEWQAPIADRTSGRGCPFCANKKVLVGYNDLATTSPLLAEEWNYERNGNLSPTDFTACSGARVWWKCYKEHEWQSTIHKRSAGRNCPICSNKQVLVGYNDLATTHPAIAEEWNVPKNGRLMPQEVTYGSQTKVWWKGKCGHEWIDSVAHRASGRGCPICSNKHVLVGYNDLVTTHPQLAEEWDYDKNTGFSPTEITYGSEKKVWWKCSNGHEWQALVLNRAHGSGCPFCFRKRKI